MPSSSRCTSVSSVRSTSRSSQKPTSPLAPRRARGAAASAPAPPARARAGVRWGGRARHAPAGYADGRPCRGCAGNAPWPDRATVGTFQVDHGQRAHVVVDAAGGLGDVGDVHRHADPVAGPRAEHVALDGVEHALVGHAPGAARARPARPCTARGGALQVVLGGRELAAASRRSPRGPRRAAPPPGAWRAARRVEVVRQGDRLSASSATRMTCSKRSATAARARARSTARCSPPAGTGRREAGVEAGVSGRSWFGGGGARSAPRARRARPTLARRAGRRAARAGAVVVAARFGRVPWSSPSAGGPRAAAGVATLARVRARRPRRLGGPPSVRSSSAAPPSPSSPPASSEVALGGLRPRPARRPRRRASASAAASSK
jgi:hypothetical protein